jgi:predicted phage terminase large subunit-like protein
MLEMTQSQIQLPSDFELALERSILKDDFYSFVVSAWSIVEPDVDYVDGWHVHAIADYLQALFEGRIPSNNLIINMPPRHMKSLLVNVFFPAWVWTRSPSKKFLCFSYGEVLTVRDSMKCRSLVGSAWYQERFTNVRIDPRNDQKSQFSLTAGGYRMCFGIGGAISGQGGDFLLIDDPLEAKLANSDAIRNSVNYTYDNSISMRGNDPKTVKKVIIMQRLHEDDPCGHVLNSDRVEKWELLILPAEYEGERFISSIGFKDPRTEMGQLLWPERFGEKEILEMKSTLGSRGIAGQLQQRPAPLEGNVYKKEWFEMRVTNPHFLGYCISWDTASKISEDSAKSAVVVGGVTDDFRLVPVYAEERKLEFGGLIHWIETIANRFRIPTFEVVIEDKSSGIQALQVLERAAPDWLREHVVGFNPMGDKTARAVLASPWCENGSVALPVPDESNESWLPLFEERIFNFPSQELKDMADSFTQLILRQLAMGHLEAGLRKRLGV